MTSPKANTTKRKSTNPLWIEPAKKLKLSIKEEPESDSYEPVKRSLRGATTKIYSYATYFSSDDDNVDDHDDSEFQKSKAKTKSRKINYDNENTEPPVPKKRGRPKKVVVKQEKIDDEFSGAAKHRKTSTKAKNIGLQKKIFKESPTHSEPTEEFLPIHIKQEKISDTHLAIKTEGFVDSCSLRNPELNSFTATVKLEKIEKTSQTSIQLKNEFVPKVNIKTEKLPTSSTSAIKQESMWIDYQLLAESQNLELYQARQIIQLFEDGNTIPFMARYRRDATGNMSPEQLREVKEAYDKINAVKEKQQSVLKIVTKAKKLTPDLRKSILCARTFEEVDHLYAPFKPGAKRSFAERAKAVGLEEPSQIILNNTCPVNLHDYINPDNKEVATIEDVGKGVMHILAHTFATDTELLIFLRKERNSYPIYIETKKLVKRDTKASKDKSGEKFVDESKFQNYFEFKNTITNIKPYQILAINRGEHLKVLSVKVNIPVLFQRKFTQYCNQRWLATPGDCDFQLRQGIIAKAIEDSYNRLVQPLIIREIRAELKERAEKAACDVFSNNVKQLLLQAPLKGLPILAIDPGYSNGCKLALISTTGSVVGFNVIFPHKNNNTLKDADILRRMLLSNQCETIVIGNGTACRETEAWLTDLISKRAFAPLDVRYTIVDESGASIYSCSPEAKKEFPDMDPNIVSAISLARRIQDPLAELVKIEPKHLGVGMYQHDVSKKQLEEALNEVVSECVSFTGVDLNTASQCLLRRIAGLTEKRATAIIEHRENKGRFISRQEIKDVKGIGPKVFEQCAGFLRVGPFSKEQEAIFYRNKNANRLDRTDIHPESYEIAFKIINKCNLNVNDIGSDGFTNAVLRHRSSEEIKRFCCEMSRPEQTISLIFDALSKPLNYDFRSEISRIPLFKKGLTSIMDLKVGSILTGCVKNVCDFGCFVDIGVGQDGLIHISKANGWSLQIGDVAEVKVINLDVARKRIGLMAIRKL